MSHLIKLTSTQTLINSALFVRRILRTFCPITKVLVWCVNAIFTPQLNELHVFFFCFLFSNQQVYLSNRPLFLEVPQQPRHCRQVASVVTDMGFIRLHSCIRVKRYHLHDPLYFSWCGPCIEHFHGYRIYKTHCKCALRLLKIVIPLVFYWTLCLIFRNIE